MEKPIALLLVGILVFASLGIALVHQTTLAAKPDKESKTVGIPPHAVKVKEGVYALGKAKDVNGKVVEGFMIIHPKKENAKPDNNPGKGKKGDNGGGDSKCFAHIAKGARWKVTEPYVVDHTNGDGLSEAFVTNTLSTSLETWDSQVGFDIFGDGTVSTDNVIADTTTPDGKNEWHFGNIAEQGTVAITILWGIFGGPPPTRYLAEWDIVFDDADYSWGNAGSTSETELGDTSVMDLQNVVAHEGGHALGLDHPSDGCLDETMYRFTQLGETKRRTLNAGDIAGISGLYK